MVFAGYLLSGPLTREPVSHRLHTPEIAVTPTAPATPAPVTEQSPGNQVEEKTPSALQAVEDVRQPKIAESISPVAPTSGTNVVNNQAWRVIENHSRKIY